MKNKRKSILVVKYDLECLTCKTICINEYIYKVYTTRTYWTIG